MQEARYIQGINRIGLWTLIRRECGRFLHVYMQTLMAPVVTSVLFYVVFSLAFGGNDREIEGLPYMQFLAPGLVMMGVVQNAFANTSSSIMISKIQGNIVDVLMPPLSAAEMAAGFIVGGIVRGLLVGFASYLALGVLSGAWMAHAPAFIFFALQGALLMSAVGLAGGIWADRFDNIAAVTNFVVTPLAFLSGTFYSVRQLPEIWHYVAAFNPFFYMIDGFRYGVLGFSETNLLTGAAVLTFCNVAALWGVYAMLRRGYKIKS